jgi:hypothetical protein
MTFGDRPGFRPIREGLALPSRAKLLVGHNIICFDLMAIRKSRVRSEADAEGGGVRALFAALSHGRGDFPSRVAPSATKLQTLAKPSRMGE